MGNGLLLRIEEAAEKIGMPKQAVRNEAERHGLLIRMGRNLRLHPDDLEELVNLCRVVPKARASTGEREKTAPTSGRSATEAPAFRPAQTAAAKLKAHSRSTSKGSTAPVVPLARKN